MSRYMGLGATLALLSCLASTQLILAPSLLFRRAMSYRSQKLHFPKALTILTPPDGNGLGDIWLLVVSGARGIGVGCSGKRVTATKTSAIMNPWGTILTDAKIHNVSFANYLCDYLLSIANVARGRGTNPWL